MLNTAYYDLWAFIDKQQSDSVILSNPTLLEGLGRTDTLIVTLDSRTITVSDS